MFFAFIRMFFVSAPISFRVFAPVEFTGNAIMAFIWFIWISIRFFSHVPKLLYVLAAFSVSNFAFMSCASALSVVPQSASV